MSWSDAKEFTLMRAVVCLVYGHPVTIGELPVNLRMKVGECGADVTV